MNANELIVLAVQQYHRGKIEDSIQRLIEAIAQAQKEGDLDTELLARTNLCEAYTRLGNCAEAMECATVLLGKSREAQLKQYELRAIGSLVMAMQQIDLRGRWQELQPLLLEGLEIARSLSISYWEVQILELLGSCATRMREYEEGLRWLQKALDALRPGEDEEEFFRTRIYEAFSNLARLRGDGDEAIRYAEIALGTASNIPHLVAIAKLALAQAQRMVGERAIALELTEEVLFWATRERWRVQEQFALYLRSEIARELGYLDTAEEAVLQALELARAMRMKEEEVKSLLSLGQVLGLLGRRDEAQHAFQQAKQISQNQGYADHLDKSEELVTGLALFNPSDINK